MLLHKKLEEDGWRLILASQSPRRRDLMRDCGLVFEAVKYDVEECYPPTTPAADVAGYISDLKSRAYAQPLGSKDILITADTVVILGDQILGKPNGVDGAKKMLSQLSNSEHHVVTGVTLRSKDRVKSFSTTTKVTFSKLTEDQIEYYISKYSPMDKAGSYGIQEWIGYIGIQSIEGSFYNVMGLPIQRLYSELSQFIDMV